MPSISCRAVVSHVLGMLSHALRSPSMQFLQHALIVIVMSSGIHADQAWQQRCFETDRQAFVADHFGGLIVFDAECRPQTIPIETLLDEPTLRHQLTVNNCTTVESFAWVDSNTTIPHLVAAIKKGSDFAFKVYRPWQRSGFNFFGFREVEFLETSFMDDVVKKEKLETINEPTAFINMFDHTNLNATLVKIWTRRIKNSTSTVVELHRVIKVSPSESYALVDNFWVHGSGPPIPYVWMHWNGNEKTATCLFETNSTAPIAFFVGKRANALIGDSASFGGPFPASVPTTLTELMYPVPHRLEDDYSGFQRFLVNSRHFISSGTTPFILYFGSVITTTSLCLIMIGCLLSRVIPSRRPMYRKRLEKIGQESLFPVVAELHAFVAALPPPPPPLVSERVGAAGTMSVIKSMMEPPKTDKLLPVPGPPSERQVSASKMPAAPSSGGNTATPTPTPTTATDDPKSKTPITKTPEEGKSKVASVGGPQPSK